MTSTAGVHRFARCIGDFTRCVGELDRRTHDFTRRVGELDRRTHDFTRRVGELDRRTHDFARRSGELDRRTHDFVRGSRLVEEEYVHKKAPFSIHVDLHVHRYRPNSMQFEPADRHRPSNKKWSNDKQFACGRSAVTEQY
jgi:hypothetical protein